MKIKNAEKLAALCLAAVMGVSVTACSGGNMYATSNESATIADNDVITIGSVTTNSGAAAAYGEAEVNGFKLAVKEINADGGIFGKQIKLESMDDKGDVIEASNAFNRLAGDKNVIAVLGPTISSTSGAVAPLADQNQMPTIAPAATADSVETGGYLLQGLLPGRDRRQVCGRNIEGQESGRAVWHGRSVFVWCGQGFCCGGEEERTRRGGGREFL